MTTLRTNMELAEQLGVQGTPATLIGDRMLPGRCRMKSWKRW